MDLPEFRMDGQIGRLIDCFIRNISALFSLCLFQVNEIYQDHSLGANINVVLVRIIMLSPSKVLNPLSKL